MSEEDELRELRELIEAEKRRINAYEDMIGVAVADDAAYKAAFIRLLELLPEGAPLKVTNSVRRKLH